MQTLIAAEPTLKPALTETPAPTLGDVIQGKEVQITPIAAIIILALFVYGWLKITLPSKKRWAMLNEANVQGYMDAEKGLSPNPRLYGLSGVAYQQYMEGYLRYRDGTPLREKEDVQFLPPTGELSQTTDTSN